MQNLVFNQDQFRAFLKSERQWSRQSRLGRARFMLKDAWAREDKHDIVMYRVVIRVNDYDEEDKVWACVR